MAANDVSLPSQLRRLILSYQVSQAIHAAATLRLADHLKDGPRNSEELARDIECHPPSLYRLLRALAAVGIVEEVENTRFALTPLGSYLRGDIAGSMRAYAIFLQEPWNRLPWAELLHCVRTGREAFEAVHGIRYFDYLARHPELEPIFNAAMSSNGWMRTNGLVATYDFAGMHTVVDVGGGQGGLLTAVLTAHPVMRGILFDRPAVIAGASKRLEAAGVAGRCEFIGGDFFASVPTGADAYILSAILHDFDDDQAVEILRSCRRAMAETSKLLVIEEVIPPGNGPHPSKFDDIHMLVLLEGRERTADEFRKLFDAAEFALTTVLTTPAPWSVVEGVPV